MSALGYEDLRERKSLLDDPEDKDGDTFEFKTDQENGSPRLTTSTTQFGGEVGDDNLQNQRWRFSVKQIEKVSSTAQWRQEDGVKAA